MREARDKSEWNRTASLLALLANIHRDPKRRAQPFAPADFHPYEKTVRPTGLTITPNTIDRLKALVDRGVGNHG